MPPRTYKNPADSTRPSMSQFIILVKLSTGLQINFKRHSALSEYARLERSGIASRSSLPLGTFRSIERRGWVKLVSGDANTGVYTLSDLGRAAMQELIDDSKSFAEFAAHLRRAQDEERGVQS